MREQGDRPPDSGRTYRANGVEIDVAAGCVRRDGREFYLRSKALQVLVHLVRARGRLVTKEELLTKVWPDVVVTEDAIAHCIAELRKALGDDARQSRFVRTLPKLGYRFVAAAEETEVGQQPMPISVEDTTSVEIEYEEMECPEQESSQSADILSRPADIPVASPVASTHNQRWLVAGLGVALTLGAASLVGTWWQRGPASGAPLSRVPGKRAVVVMPFENQSSTLELEWLREGLADMLITGLSRSRSLEVLSRQQIALLLPQIGRQRSTLKDGIEVAQRLHADTVVVGSFAALGARIRIDVRWHSAPDGRLLAGDSLTLSRPDELLSQVDTLSLKVATHLGSAPAGTERPLSSVMTDNLEAYRYYALALDKAYGFHSKEAIGLFQKALEVDPQFAMAYARIGYTYAVMWDFPEKGRPYLENAFGLSSRLAERDKLQIAAWYAIANAEYGRAIDVLRQVIAVSPGELEAYGQLAKLLQREERTDEAIAVARQAVAIDPEGGDGFHRLCSLYAEMGRHEEAISACRRYVALAPGEPNAYDSLGLAHQWAGQTEQAIDAFTHALALKPDFDIALVHLANTRFQMGQYRAALALYRRYIAAAPSNIERARGHSSISVVLSLLGDRRGAREAADAATREGGSSGPGAHFMLALETGNLEEADRLNALVNQMENAGPARGARPLLRFGAHRRGLLALAGGRAADAIAAFKEALAHQPPTFTIEAMEDCLANAYLYLKRYDDAIAEYERVLRLNPRYPLASYRLARAYEAKGLADRAQIEYTRFLEAWSTADPDLREITDARRKLSGAPNLTARRQIGPHVTPPRP